jgi:hypothetical protein
LIDYQIATLSYQLTKWLRRKIQSKRFTPKLHIRKGDNVMVIAGDDKGKKGEVLQVIP